MEEPSEVKSIARRLSNENWKIFESWRKEWRNLKEFQDHFVRPHFESSDENNDIQVGLPCNSDNESISSCGHTACFQLSFSDDASTRYESCIGTARSSLSVIQQEEDEELTTGNECFGDFQSHPDPTWYEDFSRNPSKVNKTFDLIEDETSLIERKETRDLHSPRSKGEQSSFAENYKTKLTAAVTCLLSIEPLKKYFRGIIYNSQEEDHISNTAELYATLDYMVKVFRKTRRLRSNDGLREIQRLSNECMLEHNTNETCFQKLKSILGKLHEEIILAKHKGKLKRTCLRRCRLSNRSNHSIVSHIFRGHMKKKAECTCGHKTIQHEPFTSVPLFSADFDEKTLVIPLTSKTAGNRLAITQYLLNINEYTTIKDLRSKLSHIDKHKPSQIAVASVKYNDIKVIHHSATRVFDAICSDGELHAFLAFFTDEGECTSKSESRTEDSEFVGTSTPALTDESGEENNTETLDNAKKQKKIKRGTKNIPIIFRDDACESQARTLCPPIFAQLPKEAQGNEVKTVLQRLLDMPESECKKLFITIVDTQTKSCLVCREMGCNGCYLQSKKFLNFDDDCKIIAYIPPSVEPTTVKYEEHESLATGVPANVHTVEEGIVSFCDEYSEIDCSVCGTNQFVPTKKTTISYPDILVLTINRRFSIDKNLVIPYTRFSPVLSKATKNRKQYDLSGLITSSNGFSSSSDVAYIPADAYRNEEAEGKSNIEILVYTNAQYHEKRHAKKGTSVMRGKRKGKTLGNSPCRLEDFHSFVRQEFTKENRSDAAGNSTYPTTKDDDTVSTCNCSRCQCWENCAKQIRGSEKKSSDMISEEDQFKAVKDLLSPAPTLAFQLQRAIFKQDLRRVVSLLKKGANPNELVNGSSALHIAAGLAVPAGYLLTKLLIDHGADVNLKSALGQTAVQFAASFSRSETVRMLGYHGADLSEADKIEAIRNTVNSASPLAKRYFDESDKEKESLFQTMINLKKPAGSDHQMLDCSKNAANKPEHVGALDAEATEGRLLSHNEKSIETLSEAKSEAGSLVRIELTEDLRVSDLSVGYRNDELEWGEYKEGANCCGSLYDETDNIIASASEMKTVQILDSSSHTHSLVRMAEQSVLALDEGSATIEYIPKSHVTNANRHSWLGRLCCTAVSDSEKNRNRRERSRFVAVRDYLRTKAQRLSQWLYTITN